MIYNVAMPQEGLPYETHYIVYDDFEELIDVGEAVNNLPPRDQLDRDSIRGSKAFTGTSSMAETLDLARYGWPEGTALLQDAADEITVQPAMGETVRPDIFYDVAGSEPDVGRYLSGEPENMIDFQLPPAPQGNVVEVAVEVAQSREVSTEQIMRRGAAVLAAVEAMQINGYSTAVSVATQVSSCRYPSRDLIHYVPVIKPGTYADIDRLAFAIAHPSFFRRLIFAASENTPKDLREDMGFVSGGAYGYTTDLTIVPQRDHPLVNVARYEALEGGVEAAQGVVDRVEKAIEHLREHGRRLITMSRPS